MDMTLEDKIAVITGASHGLGQAVAERLAGLGAHVVLIARRAEPLTAVAEAIKKQGGAASAFTCDVSEAEQVKATAAAIQDAFGKSRDPDQQCRNPRATHI